MPDQFTQVTTQSYGSRIVGSIGGVLIGIIFFIASFGVLYWNEGRVDLSTVALKTTEISANDPSALTTFNQKPISITGPVTSTETLGDNLFLKTGNFIALNRSTEIYAWKENRESQSQSNTGGSQTTQTTYTYTMGWVNSPADSSNFKYPAGHQNPQKTINDESEKVQTANIGSLNFSPAGADLRGLTAVPLNQTNTTLSQGAVLSGNYIFIPVSASSTMVTPQVGDVRISYSALPDGTVATLFGQLSGSTIEPYLFKGTQSLFYLSAGSRTAAINQMHSEFSLLLWILRAVGFILMWLGLSMLLAPINVVLDFLPMAGSISKGVTGGISLVIALILSILTILVSMILHNIIALLITVILVAAIIIIFMKMHKKNNEAIPTPPSTPV